MVSPIKRRSARRTQVDSTSESKSPPSSHNSPDLAPPTSAPADALSTRSAASSSSNKSDNMRAAAKRTKEDSVSAEDFQEPPAPPQPSSSHRRTSSIASTANANASNNAQPPPNPSSTSSKRKRKGKDARTSPKEDNVETASAAPTETDAVQATDEKQEDDGGVTRCVCEGSEEDGDLGFMIQCELCMAWQHGPCMGFASESEIPSGDYYCEQCKPQDHINLFKKLSRVKRQTSERANASNASRASRSHSPTQFLKSAKRRNTMNSRDADYEAQIQKLLASTAAEADGAAPDDGDQDEKASVAKSDDGAETIIEIGPGVRKKRKRVDDEVMASKRKRSASVASEQINTNTASTEKPDTTTPVTTEMLPPPTPVTNKSRARRGGNRKGPASVTQEPSVNGDVEEAPPAPQPIKKHPNQYTYRAKSGTGQNRRAPSSAAGVGQLNGTSHDHGTRRNANQSNAASGSSGTNMRGGGAASQNSVQLPLFQSWGLPDYLSHLQGILPSEVPPPLQIRGPSSFTQNQSNEISESPVETVGTAGSTSAPPTSTESTSLSHLQPLTMSRKAAPLEAEDTITERGAKIKWPAKRMSVADMNKRVRALVEWVGREQALGADRGRRRTALEIALKKQRSTEDSADGGGADKVVDDRMVVDGNSGSEDAQAGVNSVTPIPAPKSQLNHISDSVPPRSSTPRSMFAAGLPNGAGVNGNGRLSTDQMLEELMQELLNFQMRFGPGAKSTTRDRRTVAVS